MIGIDLVTIIIIVVNAIISFKGFNDFAFFEKYKFNIGGIQRGEQYRFFTSAFLHADMQHLLFNMITLYFFAPFVVNFLGDKEFVICYLISLLAGNGLSYIVNKNDYHYSAIGASGAVMGIVYAAIVLVPDLRIYGIIPGYIFGIGYMVYTIYGMKTKRDNIGHDAHFGGAVAGLAVAIAFSPSIVYDSYMEIGLMLIPVIIFGVLKQQKKI